MKRYKPKNQTYATAFKVLLSVNHHLIIGFTEGHRWHEVALDHGVMHWFEEVDEFSHLPKSANEIDGRDWIINGYGHIGSSFDYQTENNVSTKERAEAFLALMQLVELRDAWNDGWKADFRKEEQKKYCIIRTGDSTMVDYFWIEYYALHFKTEKLAKGFHKQFKDLIESAKELI